MRSVKVTRCQSYVELYLIAYVYIVSHMYIAVIVCVYRNICH